MADLTSKKHPAQARTEMLDVWAMSDSCDATVPLQLWWLKYGISESDQAKWCKLINHFAKKYKSIPEKVGSKKSRKSTWSPERRLMFFDHYLELQEQFPDKSYAIICDELKDHALWKGELPSIARLRNLISEIKTDLSKRGLLVTNKDHD